MNRTGTQKVVDDLERYASENDGVYWLPYLDDLEQDLEEPVLIIADFPRGEYSALYWADQTFNRLGIRVDAIAVGDIDKDRLRKFMAKPIKFGTLVGRLQSSIPVRNAIEPFGEFLVPTLSYRVNPGWASVIVDFLTDVRKILPAGETFVLTMATERNGNLMLKWASTLPEDFPAEEAIWKANARAAFDAQRTCEACGRPGTMRVTEDDERFVACHEHAGGYDEFPMPPIVVVGDRTYHRDEVSDG